MKIIFSLAVLLVMIPATIASAQGTKLKAAREAAEFVLKKFGVKIVQEGTEKLAGKLARVAVKYGDDVFVAAKRVGPRVLKYADEAGDAAGKSIRLLARHGDDAATFVLSRPVAMKLFRTYGDDAAEALLKHPGIAEPLIEGFGKPAIVALGKLGPQNGRRLAMLAQGEFARIGRSDDLLGVIGRFGDRACEFVWRKKGALAVGATLGAFLSDPEPFLDGAASLADSVAEHVVAPLADPVGRAAGEVVRDGGPLLARIAAVILIAGTLLGAAAIAPTLLRRKPHHETHP